VGVLDRFEKGIERAVNGVFARAFRSEVQPVELASALKREADDNASVVGRNRTNVPNDYVIELGPADHRRLGQWEDALGDELSTVLSDHALQQRYAFVGPIRVRFEQAEELDTGVFRVRSRTVRVGDQGDAAPDAGQSGHPAGAPRYPSYQEEDGSPYPAGSSSASPQYPAQQYPGQQYPGPQYPASPYPAQQYPAPDAGSPHQGSPYPPSQYPPAPSPRPAPVLEVDGRRVPLNRPVTVLGRSGEVDVPLDDAGVSRRHAEIHVTGNGARVVDLGSTNGTFVDGERVGTGELRDGSTITVGRSRLVFRLGQR
jgi:hypothetical protein